MTDDEFRIPHEWHEARPYLQEKLEDRRTRLDRRDDVLEGKINALEQEVHGVRMGVGSLNESFRSVADQNALLINMLNTDQQAQHERWVEYDKEHKKMLEIVSHTDNVVTREDRWRFGWRLSLVIGLYATLFVLMVEKAT